MNDPIIGVDLCEYNKLDPQKLADGGVKFVILRLNDIEGGHHLDQAFTINWQRLGQQFIKWPYFVYNPWVDGQSNFDFLSTHMPSDAKHVSIDVEAAWANRTPADYAAGVQTMLNLCAGKWTTDIYTGGSCVNLLKSWPVIDYWWARYPFAFYPDARIKMEWSDLRAQLARYPWSPVAVNGGNVKIPGPCRLWQISGDKFIMPGCGDSPADVDVWNGTIEDLAVYAGCAAPAPQSWSQALDAWARTMGYAGPRPA